MPQHNHNSHLTDREKGRSRRGGKRGRKEGKKEETRGQNVEEIKEKIYNDNSEYANR